MEPELDDLLRHYRPAGPPPDLRARVVAGVAPAGRAWPWAAAAAVLLAATVGLQLWTRDLYDRMASGLGLQQMSVLEHYPALESAVEGDALLKARLEALARQERLQSTPPLLDAAPSWQ